MDDPDNINYPAHYNNYSFGYIDALIKLYGIEKTITFCEMIAFKYRLRMGPKKII